MLVYESGGPAVHAGLVDASALPGDRGRITSEQVRGTRAELEGRRPARRAFSSLEHTHNASGGRVWPLDELGAVAATARELGLVVHLDGARLLNAVGRARRRPPPSIGAIASTPSRSASRRASAARSARSSPARARRWARRGARSSCSAARCARPGSSRRRRSTRSTTTSSGSPTITRARARLAEGSHEAGLPVDLEQVETNFVRLEVEPLGLTTDEATERDRRRGVLVGLSSRPRDVLRVVDVPRRRGRGHRRSARGDSARPRASRCRRSRLRSPTSRNASATSP